ncbi:MAG: helix-turn-helix transcriptional regulator [Ramlibacter sp.]
MFIRVYPMTAAPIDAYDATMKRAVHPLPAHTSVSFVELAPAADCTLGKLVQAIGTPEMESIALAVLHAGAGVEHCSVFKLYENSLEIIGAASLRHAPGVHQGLRYVDEGYWRFDPTIARAFEASRTGVTLAIHIPPSEMPDARLRKMIYDEQGICDRVFVAGERAGTCYGVSLVSSVAHGGFEARELEWIGESADILISALARDAELKGGISPAEFPPMTEIEQRLERHAPSLTRREVQVCARVIRGVFTPGIATDLGIGEESVNTYRKRAYARLGIGTRFELFNLFLHMH